MVHGVNIVGYTMSINTQSKTQSTKYVKYEFSQNLKDTMLDFVEEQGDKEKHYSKSMTMFHKLCSHNKIRKLTHDEKRYLYEVAEAMRTLNETNITYYYAEIEAKALLDNVQEVKENLQQENAILMDRLKLLESRVKNQDKEIKVGKKVIESLKVKNTQKDDIISNLREVKKMDDITYNMAKKEHEYDAKDYISNLKSYDALLDEKTSIIDGYKKDIKLQAGETQHAINELHEQLQATYKQNDYMVKIADENRTEIYKLKCQNTQLTKASGACPEFLAKNF